jgi:hypothetical protein
VALRFPALLEIELLRFLETSDNLSEVIDAATACQTSLAKMGKNETVRLRGRYPSAIKAAEG